MTHGMREAAFWALIGTFVVLVAWLSTGCRIDGSPCDPAECDCPWQDECYYATDATGSLIYTCEDISVDVRHCGGCGYACEPGQHCAEGICTDGPPPAD